MTSVSAARHAAVDGARGTDIEAWAGTCVAYQVAAVALGAGVRVFCLLGLREVDPRIGGPCAGRGVVRPPGSGRGRGSTSGPTVAVLSLQLC